METLFRLLPGPQSLAVRYGAATLMVLFAFALRLGIEGRAGEYGFLLFILPIVAAALLFDRGTGFYATGLSAALVASLLDWEANPRVHIAALAVFLLVSSCLVLIAEGLHRALEAAHTAQRAADLLLQEMSHRVKNKFAMISSIIALQARQSPPDVRAALDDVASRVNVIATVHSYLQLSRQEGLIDMGAYLSGLCRSLEQALGLPRAVALTATSADVKLTPEKALSVGVIVNELVTNAIKYAFEDGRPGRVLVELGQEGGQLVLSVMDNGKGCEQAGTGLGTRLVTVFATQLGGGASWQRSDDGGCRAVMRFPA